MSKSAVFLHPRDKQLGVEIKNNVYNYIKNMKYLGLNLTSNVQNLHSEAHDALLNESKEFQSGVLARVPGPGDPAGSRCERSLSSILSMQSPSDIPAGFFETI